MGACPVSADETNRMNETPLGWEGGSLFLLPQHTWGRSPPGKTRGSHPQQAVSDEQAEPGRGAGP